MKDKLQAFFSKITTKLKSLGKKKSDQNPDHTGEFQIDTDLDDIEINKPGANPKRNPAWKEKLTHLTSKVSKMAAENQKTQAIQGKITEHWDRLFTESYRGLIHQTFIWSLVFSLTFLVGKLMGLTLSALSPESKSNSGKIFIQPSSLENTLAVVKRENIFRAKQGGEAKIQKPKKVVISEAICDDSSASSRLPIKLINTIVLQDTVKSVASVQVRGSNDLQQFREGEKIDSFAKIGRIGRLKVFLRNLQNGQCEFIENDNKLTKSVKPISFLNPRDGKKLLEAQRPKGITNEGNNFAITKALLQEKLKDPAALFSSALAVEVKNPDGSISFKLSEVEPGGFFSFLGIENEDVITQINGRKITSATEILNLFSRIQSLSKLNLTIERDGTPTDRVYNIVE